MTTEEAQGLKDLLQQLRGEQSIRKFCKTISIHYAAWRSWESLESSPNLSNLQLVADLKGWSLNQITAYLKTGNCENNPYTVDELLRYGQQLSFDQRIELARKLLK